MRDRERAAVRAVEHDGLDPGMIEEALHLRVRDLRLRIADSRRARQPDQLVDRHAELDAVGLQPEHPQELLVVDDQPRVPVEHRQPLRHVVEGGVEKHVLRAQLVARALDLLPGTLQRRERPIEHPQRKYLDREVHAEAEQRAEQGDQPGLDQQGSQAGGNLDAAGRGPADDDRGASGHGRSRQLCAFLEDEAVAVVENALMNAFVARLGQLDQFRQARALILPEPAMSVDVLGQPIGIQLRLEHERRGLVGISDQQEARGNRNRGGQRDA